jgi:hypothetical protein
MQAISTNIKRVAVPAQAFFFFSALAFSQAPAPERTIDEIKTEAIHRAENGMYPLIGLDPADVGEALASVKTRDKD